MQVVTGIANILNTGSLSPVFPPFNYYPSIFHYVLRKGTGVEDRKDYGTTTFTPNSEQPSHICLLSDGSTLGQQLVILLEGDWYIPGQPVSAPWVKQNSLIQDNLKDFSR